jgi:ADP-ribose pyrophosphatase YjhB (NUDIX family)
VALGDAVYRLGLRVAWRALRVYWRVFQPVTRGVFVAVWVDGRVLVIRNSYKPYDSLPAGYLRRNEALAVAARRELGEEVGIDAPVEALRFVRTLVDRSEGKVDEVHFFELELRVEPEVRVDRREVIWGGFETPEQALARRLSPPVRLYLSERGPGHS